MDLKKLGDAMSVFTTLANEFDQKYGPTSLQAAAMERVGEISPMIGTITLGRGSNPTITTSWIPRSFEDIEASLQDNPNEDKLSFSAAEMRMVLAAWKAESNLGQKFREMVYTNVNIPASADQIADRAAGEIMKNLAGQYPLGGVVLVKTGVQAVIAAAIASAAASAVEVPRAAAPAGRRKWTLLLVGADHGLVGEFGKRWAGEEAYDHVDVVEAAPATAVVEEFGAISKPITADEATLRNIQSMIHDNELTTGDRLQRLTLQIDLILAGHPDEIPAYKIREPSNPLELFNAQLGERNAYLERNQLVAALAKLFPSGLARTKILNWNDDWHNCVYIDLPTGQVSWHYHDSHAALFAGLPHYFWVWDGHSTEEKYQRLAALRRPGMSDKCVSIGQAYGVAPEVVDLILKAGA